MALVLSGSIDISGSMTATTIIVSAPGVAGMVSSSAQITELAPLMAYTASLKTSQLLSGSGLTNYVPIYNGTTALSSSIIFQSTGSIGASGKGITIGSNVPMYKFAVNPVANTYFGIGYTDTDSVFMTAVDNTYLPKPIVYAATSYKWYATSLTSTYNLTMVIQSSSLNVGFGGIENPLHRVDISGSARVSNGLTVSGSLNITGSLIVGGTGVTHYIGESYGGGIVFYVYDGGKHGLIAATSDQSTGVSWYNGGYAAANAPFDGINAGIRNTTSITTVYQTGSYAAEICAFFNGGNFGDWYLPSKYELNLLYQQKSVVGGFAEQIYWSSTELHPNNARASSQNFANGVQANHDKSTTFWVRAIRAF